MVKKRDNSQSVSLCKIRQLFICKAVLCFFSPFKKASKDIVLQSIQHWTLCCITPYWTLMYEKSLLWPCMDFRYITSCFYSKGSCHKE